MTNFHCPLINDKSPLVPALRVGTHRSDAPRPCRGLTLVEMVVVMTVSAVLMGIAAGLLQYLMRAQNGVQSHRELASSLARLAGQFRSDAHAASGTLTSDGKTAGTWRLQLPGGRVAEYVAQVGTMTRRERLKGTAVSEESYILPQHYSATMAADGAAGRTLVTLTIVPETPSTPANRIMRIEAALGRDHRFQTDRDRSQ